MLPQLTETWAATYLQVIATMLVFALGIPALIVQVIVREDLRRIIHRRLMIFYRVVFLLSVLIAVVCASFVWFLHPCPGSHISDQQHLVAAIVVTMALFLPIVSWLIFSRECLRDTAIHRLKGESTRTIHSSGTLAEKPLTDLIRLGEQGDAGLEKMQVLEALNYLAAQVQGWESYEGDELEQLVQGIETILVGGGQRGSIDNFRLAAGILGRIVARSQERRLIAAPDMGITLRTLGRLGVGALDLEFERATLAYLEPIASSAEGEEGAFQSASQRLFEIGTSALETKRFLIAVAALNKLETLAEYRVPLSGEISADLLGLLAHFWTADSKAARGHAQRILSRTEAFFSPSLQDSLRSAIEHQIRTTQFDTADKLIIMLDELVESDVPGD